MAARDTATVLIARALPPDALLIDVTCPRCRKQHTVGMDMRGAASVAFCPRSGRRYTVRLRETEE